jgi:hypothetical protein
MSTKRICAWCKKELGTTNQKMSDDNKISHGICPACYELQFKEIKALEDKSNKSVHS